MLKIRLIVLLFIVLVPLFLLVTLTFAAGPDLRIVKPTGNAVVNGYIVEVRFETKNFVLKDYRNNPKPVSGQGHLNLWLDQEKLDSSTAQKWFRDIPYTFADVVSGDHTLVVELVGNDNVSLNPKVTQTVKFTTVSDNSKSNSRVTGRPLGAVESASEGSAGNETAATPALNPLLRVRLPIIIGVVTLFFGVLGSIILKN